MKIVIVGGGTAGWLSAFGFCTAQTQHQYTLIDSSRLGTIGVGESTTGAFHAFAMNRGISRFELIRGCNALPKYAIKMFNWRKDGLDYISPSEGSVTAHHYVDWMMFSALANDKPLYYNSQGAIAATLGKSDYRLIDGQIEEVFGGKFPLHIDTYATGQFFKEKSLERGVNHIDSKVLDVQFDSESGFVKSIVLENGQIVEGDLFIDCSGFSQVIIGKMGAEWKDYSEHLPVNSAIPFNLLGDDNLMNPYTTARALSAGWMWEIPSRNQTNRGYIYDDRFIKEEQAIDEIEKFFGKKIEKVKSIKFKAGRLSNPWIKNCVAIGLSSAFLEPLQATSVHCTLSQIEDFITNCLDETLDLTVNKKTMKLYNEKISLLYSSMADLISLHYTNNREDTNFWKFVSNDVNPTDKVIEILELAKHRGPRSADYKTQEYHAGQPIWNHTLFGLGHVPKEVPLRIFKNFNVNLDDSLRDLEYVYRENSYLLENTLTVDEANTFLKNQA